MKTTMYNPASEIRYGVLFVVLTIIVFTAVRVKELNVNDEPVSGGLRTGVVHTGLPVLPILEARLIDEPLAETPSSLSVISEKAGKELTFQLKTWMEDSAFWSDEAVISDQEITKEIVNWNSNGTFWDKNNTELETTLSAGTVNQPATDFQKTVESDSDEAVVARQMESWFNNGEYWDTAN